MTDPLVSATLLLTGRHADARRTLAESWPVLASIGIVKAVAHQEGEVAYIEIAGPPEAMAVLRAMLLTCGSFPVVSGQPVVEA